MGTQFTFIYKGCSNCILHNPDMVTIKEKSIVEIQFFPLYIVVLIILNSITLLCKRELHAYIK